MEPVDGTPAGDLLAADSWLVDEGRVRGYDAHWARFSGWCAGALVAASEPPGFRAAVTAALPRRGRWLPRVDLLGQADERRLLLRIRPAQPSRHDLRVRVLLAERGDPRSHPRLKGPDLPLLLGLRADAVARGADELVLRDRAGRLVEGALSSLVWWEDDVLCATPDELTLPSVTRELLFGLARERSVEVRRRSPFAAELDECEAWLVNAAQGICVVGAWGPGGPAPGPGIRAVEWCAALAATARHLDG